MSAEYYVYVYWDPRQDPEVPIYVGKGKGSRRDSHKSWTHNQHLRRKIAKIRHAGLEPRVDLASEGLNSNEASEVEKTFIQKYGRLDLGTGTLCNFTDGGEGTPGRVPSPETRELWSRQRSQPQTPAQYAANCQRRHTVTSKAKISEATQGHRWHTPEQIEAIKESNATREVTAETRAKMSRTRKAKGLSPSQQEKMRRGKEQAQAARTPEEQAAIVEKSARKNRGQRRSEETKRKMREAWERRRAAWGPSGHPPKESK